MQRRPRRPWRKIFTGEPIAHQGARVSAAIGTLQLALSAYALEEFEERIFKLENQSRDEDSV
jgi:hypothetical protein